LRHVTIARGKLVCWRIGGGEDRAIRGMAGHSVP